MFTKAGGFTGLVKLPPENLGIFNVEPRGARELLAVIISGNIKSFFDADF